MPGLRLEDPRLDRYMAAPPRRADTDQPPWVTRPVAGERVSISLNYGWF